MSKSDLEMTLRELQADGLITDLSDGEMGRNHTGSARHHFSYKIEGVLCMTTMYSSGNPLVTCVRHESSPDRDWGYPANCYSHYKGCSVESAILSLRESIQEIENDRKKWRNKRWKTSG